MDEFSGLRAEMEAAIRQDDIAHDRFDRFERKWAQREALLAADDIEEPQRKTFDPQPKPQQQSAATMDAATKRSGMHGLSNLFSTGLTTGSIDFWCQQLAWP